MNRLFLIEDDENKKLELTEFLEQVLVNPEITVAGSYQTALRRLVENHFDLILLDMTIPSFEINAEEDGGRPQAYGGRSILRQMERRNIVVPVIVVTQFDVFGDEKEAMTLPELDHQLAARYTRIYRGSVYYNATIDDWKADLMKKVKGVLG